DRAKQDQRGDPHGNRNRTENGNTCNIHRFVPGLPVAPPGADPPPDGRIGCVPVAGGPEPLAAGGLFPEGFAGTPEAPGGLVLFVLLGDVPVPLPEGFPGAVIPLEFEMFGLSVAPALLADPLLFVGFA